MNIEGRQFVLVLQCQDCGTELNRTKQMTMQEIWERWAMLVMGSGLVAGKCPKKCRSTYSDWNINTELQIVDVATSKPVELATHKKLTGEFYSEDYADVCRCDQRPDDEIYESDKYPAVHGRCGKFLEPYLSQLTAARPQE